MTLNIPENRVTRYVPDISLYKYSQKDGWATNTFRITKTVLNIKLARSRKGEQTEYIPQLAIIYKNPFMRATMTVLQ